jgi:hypothetical protein
MKMSELEGFSSDESRKWGLLAGILGVILYFVFQRYMIGNRAAISALYVSLLVFFVRIYWGRRKSIRFWASVGLIGFTDVCLVVVVPISWWPSSLLVLGLAALAQMAISFAIVWIFELRIHKH